MAFPGKLIPAFTARLVLEVPVPVGALATGASLVHVSLKPDVSTLVSEPGYAATAALDAVLIHGADYIKRDADAGRVRLDTDSLLRDRATGAHVRFHYQGVIDTTGPSGKVLGGAPDAKTTGFGESFVHCFFETAHKDLAAIMNKVYVGVGQFIVEPGKLNVIEYKISEVVL